MSKESLEEDVRDEQGTARGRIRCPKCVWQPTRHDRWRCRCMHVWNTFDTRGVCPSCRYAWRETQCLRCHQWSLHVDWYEKEAGQRN
jgi:hypothetical protein